MPDASRHPEVSAFVLAGGLSTRMGSDKAMLELDGQTLMDRAVGLAVVVADEVRVVGPAGRFVASLRPVEDIYPGHGPLGGIHAALSGTPSELNLILAVDCPFVAPQFLRFLLAEARKSRAVVTLPRTAVETTEGRGSGTRLHPLCAIYRRAFAAAAERALREDRNKIEPLLAEVATRIIEPHELRGNGFDAAMFRNLNTPADLERARRL